MAYTTINKGSSYFNTVLYTGNSSTQSITGVGFKPDLVWIKDRIGATSVYSHYWFDIIRTATKYIKSNANDAEATGSNYLTSFDTDGFSLGSYAGVNATGDATVAWNWLASNTTVSNTSGSVTSTVSVNTTSGFSVVQWTTSGSSGNNSIGHGLGVAPKMIIMKATDITYNWDVFHNSIMPTGAGRMILNSTAAYDTSFNPFGSVAPTSTVFYNSTGFYGNAHTVIAYCFADVKGFSKFGSYTGNGSADGTFVYTGFKPAWVMAKRTDGIDWWGIWDSKRNTSNVVDKRIYANTSDSEQVVNNLDILSNGFKIRTTDGAINASGGTYIYAAFAENPFVTSTGLPVTAR